MPYLHPGLIGVTDEDFVDRIWENGGRVFLILGAGWCEQTQHLLDDVLPKYLKTYSDAVTFLYAEIEGKEPGVFLTSKIKVEFDVMQFPTILGFVDGQDSRDCVGEFTPKNNEQQEADVRKLLVLLGVLDRE